MKRTQGLNTIVPLSHPLGQQCLRARNLSGIQLFLTAPIFFKWNFPEFLNYPTGLALL